MIYKLILLGLVINSIFQIYQLYRERKIIERGVGEYVEWTPDIKVKYFHDSLCSLGSIGGNISDWIDLRCAKEIELKAGEFKLIPLGVAMEIPEGFEAHVAPRSSTFKKWGIIQTNSVGVIDRAYCGDNDQWLMPVYATRDTVINFNDRICQFRIIPTMGIVNLIEVESLENEDRGGIGSTGVQ